MMTTNPTDACDVGIDVGKTRLDVALRMNGRAVGRGLREFKDSLSGVGGDDDREASRIEAEHRS